MLFIWRYTQNQVKTILLHRIAEDNRCSVKVKRRIMFSKQAFIVRKKIVNKIYEHRVRESFLCGWSMCFMDVRIGCLCLISWNVNTAVHDKNLFELKENKGDFSA